MAATDYVIVKGFFDTCYIARKKKPTKGGMETISLDRRPIEDGEIIGLFESYLRKWCREHRTDTVVIRKGGKNIFEATLYKEEK